MPKMDGVELVTKIRETHSKNEIAIIGISSNGNSAMSAKFIKHGANDFLVKPFCEEELYCRLNHNIEFLEQIWHIKKSANTDFLTQLSNRRYLTEFIENLPSYQSKPMNLAILDIDHFKRINDGFGHDVGDLALKHLAKILVKNFPVEIPARFGGEEFCIIDTTIPKKEFADKVDNLRLQIQNSPLLNKERKIVITVSIGCVNSNKSLREMLIDADTLLYKAKKSGRNITISD
jgi:diguanylate cyclase (GGDEF)-like protein